MLQNHYNSCVNECKNGADKVITGSKTWDYAHQYSINFPVNQPTIEQQNDANEFIFHIQNVFRVKIAKLIFLITLPRINLMYLHE